jgi:hypothetical protein
VLFRKRLKIINYSKKEEKIKAVIFLIFISFAFNLGNFHCIGSIIKEYKKELIVVKNINEIEKFDSKYYYQLENYYYEKSITFEENYYSSEYSNRNKFTLFHYIIQVPIFTNVNEYSDNNKKYWLEIEYKLAFNENENHLNNPKTTNNFMKDSYQHFHNVKDLNEYNIIYLKGKYRKDNQIKFVFIPVTEDLDTIKIDLIYNYIFVLVSFLFCIFILLYNIKIDVFSSYFRN